MDMSRMNSANKGQFIRTASGQRIFYDSSGDGPPLLLIMGAGESRRLWADEVSALAKHFTVITLDNRDSGESDQEKLPYSVEDMGEDVVELLDALGIQRADLIGTSMGSQIAMAVALNAPMRVNRLVLLSSSAGGDTQLPVPPREQFPPDHATYIRVLFPGFAAPGYFDHRPERLEELVALGGENNLSYEGLVRTLNAVNAFDMRERVAEIDVPTLVVWGEKDPLYSRQQAEGLARRIPNAQFVAVPDAGHILFLEKPEQVTQIVLDFLLDK